MAFPTPSNWYRSTVKDMFDRVTSGPDIGDTWKVALFDNTLTQSTNFDAATSNFYGGTTIWGTDASTSKEVPNANGYTTGGASITLATSITTPTATGTPLLVNASAASVWTLSGAGSWTARGALIYDTTNTIKYGLVAVNFGADFTPSGTGATLTVTWGAGSPFTVFQIA
jgi:hypothetical protein